MTLLQVYKQTSVYQQCCSCDIPTQLAACEEQGRPGHVLRLSQPSQRYPPFHIHLLVRSVGQILLIQLRPDSPRQQRIAADVVLPQRRRAALHQRQYTTLCRRIVALLRPSHQRTDTAHTNNTSPAGTLLHHLPRRSLHAIKGTTKIRALMPLPALRFNIQKLLKFADARVRDERIQSPELLNRFFHELRTRFRHGDIPRHSEEGTILFFRIVLAGLAGFDRSEGVGAEGGEELFVRRIVAGEIVDGDAGAVGEEQDGDGASDARQAASYG